MVAVRCNTRRALIVAPRRRLGIFSALPPTLQAINAQNRIAPAPNEPKAIGGGNARQIGPATTGSIDNMVSREEQPATVAPPKTARRDSLSRTGAPMTSTADQAIPNQAVPRVAVTAGAPAPPAAIAATPQGLDQSTGADATAPPTTSILLPSLSHIQFGHCGSDRSRRS